MALKKHRGVATNPPLVARRLKAAVDEMSRIDGGSLFHAAVGPSTEKTRC